MIDSGRLRNDVKIGSPLKGFIAEKTIYLSKKKGYREGDGLLALNLSIDSHGTCLSLKYFSSQGRPSVKLENMTFGNQVCI